MVTSPPPHVIGQAGHWIPRGGDESKTLAIDARCAKLERVYHSYKALQNILEKAHFSGNVLKFVMFIFCFFIFVQIVIPKTILVQFILKVYSCND